jgi:hypothetical protein
MIIRSLSERCSQWEFFSRNLVFLRLTADRCGDLERDSNIGRDDRFTQTIGHLIKHCVSKLFGIFDANREINFRENDCENEMWSDIVWRRLSRIIPGMRLQNWAMSVSQLVSSIEYVELMKLAFWTIFMTLWSSASCSSRWPGGSPCFHLTAQSSQMSTVSHPEADRSRDRLTIFFWGFERLRIKRKDR